MSTYEYNYEREEEIKSIASQSAMKKYLKTNHSYLNQYEWYLVSKNKYFSLEMVPEEDLDSLSWEYICSSLDLTQSQLNKYSDYLNWYTVSCFQKFDEKFLKKNKELLSLDQVRKNLHLDQKVIKVAERLYKSNNDLEHQKIWRDNLKEAKMFRPQMKKELHGSLLLPPLEAIPSLQKDQIKHLLDQAGEKYLYKDTLDILQKKLISLKEAELNRKKQEDKEAEEKYDAFLLDHITKHNPQEVVVEETTEEPVKEEDPAPKVEEAPVKKERKKRKVDYTTKTKDQLKKILDKRKVKYLYKDTLAILIQKCQESE